MRSTRCRRSWSRFGRPSRAGKTATCAGGGAAGTTGGVGIENICAHVKNHDTVILDGLEGLVILTPDREILGHYHARRQHLEYVGRALHKLGSLPAETQDGYRVRVTANIEFPAELPQANAHGAEGIGLYRSEFLY